MIPGRTPRQSLIILATVLLFMAGCATSPPSRFYLLQSLSSSALESGAQAKDQGVAIGIGPINLPDYLDRPQIVTRNHGNELRLDEFNRWAEPMGQNLSRVLAENLGALLDTQHIALYPWPQATPIEYRIKVDVYRLDGSLGGRANLSARWTIYSGDLQKILMVRKSDIAESADAATYEALVSAESRAVAVLSREIATALLTLVKANGSP
jgi:uncharacterized lipoprotein YmbA